MDDEEPVPEKQLVPQKIPFIAGQIPVFCAECSVYLFHADPETLNPKNVFKRAAIVLCENFCRDEISLLN